MAVVASEGEVFHATLAEDCQASPHSSTLAAASDSRISSVPERKERRAKEGKNLPNGIPALTPSPSISRKKIRKGRRTDGARLKSSLNVAEGRGGQEARQPSI